MLALRESLASSEEQLVELLGQLQNAPTIAAMVLIALQIARFLAVKLVEAELSRRAEKKTKWPFCKKCGRSLQSKGFKARQLITLVGKVSWKRRGGRCPNKCQIGQVAPLDQELNLQSHQSTGQNLKRVACALAVFVPFEIASVLLTLLTGVQVSPTSIWNWVQEAGQFAMTQLQKQLDALALGELPDNLAEGYENLLLAVGADGVMVSFRPFGFRQKAKQYGARLKLEL